MPIIHPVAAQKLQPELLSGESIYWTGMPDPNKIFHSDDWTMIPFSLLWGGFSIFWEAGVLGYFGGSSKPAPHPVSYFMALGGVPFILIGQYMIWGRFVLDAWLKQRTYYAVTNRRVLILQEGWKRRTNCVFLESLPELSYEGTSIGTVWLGPKLPTFGRRGRSSQSWRRFSLSASTAVLADIDNPDYVQRLILDLREKSRVPAQPVS